MLCKVCGRTITNEEANFCEYCGTSFREGVDNGFPEFSYQNRKDNQTINVVNNNSQNIPFVVGHSSEFNSSIGEDKNKELKPAIDMEVSQGEIEKPMTFGNWMSILLLLFIPMIGPFVYTMVLFVMAFGGRVSETKKNRARATLLVLVCSLVMLIITYSNYSSFLGGLI